MSISIAVGSSKISSGLFVLVATMEGPDTIASNRTISNVSESEGRTYSSTCLIYSPALSRLRWNLYCSTGSICSVAVSDSAIRVRLLQSSASGHVLPWSGCVLHRQGRCSLCLIAIFVQKTDSGSVNFSGNWLPDRLTRRGGINLEKFGLTKSTW